MPYFYQPKDNPETHFWDEAIVTLMKRKFYYKWFVYETGKGKSKIFK
jgi:hypothetical protein